MKLNKPLIAVFITIFVGALLVWGVSHLRQRARIRAEASRAELFRKYIEHDEKMLADGGNQLFYYSTENTDRLLAEFRRRPEVENVGFEDTDVTALGFEVVSEFPNLKEVFVTYGNYNFDDRCLQKLANHPNLEKVVLLQTLVTDDGLSVLATLPNLRSLRINNWKASKLSADSVDDLTSIQQLEELILGGKWVTDDILAKLQAAMPNTRVERDTQDW